MRLCVRTLLLLSTLVLPALVHAQNPDPRDYEVGFFVPSHTTVINTYLRHVSATKGRDVSVDALAFRATHIIKFGDLVFTPLDVILPVQDVRAFTPLSALNPAFAAVPRDFKLTSHASGVGDVVYLPTIGHGINENNEDHTHTYYALTMYITAPTGQYNKHDLVNVGGNRWIFNPLVMVGQRFLRAFTFEVMANLAFFTNNSDYRGPTTLTTGPDFTLKQKPSFSAAAHLGIDLHPLFYVAGSYWLALNGRRELDDLPGGAAAITETRKNTVHSFRLNFGIRVTPQTLILAQWQEDLERSNNAGVLTHFFGLRLTHAFFAPRETPTRAPVTDVAVPVQLPPPSDQPLPSQKLVDPNIAPPPEVPPVAPAEGPAAPPAEAPIRGPQP